MKFPSLRNRELPVAFIKLSTYLDIVVSCLAILIIIVNCIFKVEVMNIFIIWLLIWFVVLNCIYASQLDNITSYKSHILAHSKNTVTIISVFAMCYFSYRAYYFSKVRIVNDHLIYFIFVYVGFAIYYLLSWIVSFPFLGTTEKYQLKTKGWGKSFIELYPVVYSKGINIKYKNYDEAKDWASNKRGFSQKKGKFGRDPHDVPSVKNIKTMEMVSGGSLRSKGNVTQQTNKSTQLQSARSELVVHNPTLAKESLIQGKFIQQFDYIYTKFIFL